MFFLVRFDLDYICCLNMYSLKNAYTNDLPNCVLYSHNSSFICYAWSLYSYFLRFRSCSTQIKYRPGPSYDSANEDDPIGNIKPQAVYCHNAVYRKVSHFKQNTQAAASVQRSSSLSDSSDIQSTFMLSRKGGVHLVHGHFVYRSNMTRQGRDMNKIYWECIHNRSIKCRGRLKSIGNRLFVTNGKLVLFHGRNIWG